MTRLGWDAQATRPTKNQTEVMVDGWSVMLFDLSVDPEERSNIAMANLSVVRKMLKRLMELADPANGYRDPQLQPVDPNYAPDLHDGCLAPWLDEEL